MDSTSTITCKGCRGEDGVTAPPQWFESAALTVVPVLRIGPRATADEGRDHGCGAVEADVDAPQYRFRACGLVNHKRHTPVVGNADVHWLVELRACGRPVDIPYTSGQAARVMTGQSGDAPGLYVNASDGIVCRVWYQREGATGRESHVSRIDAGAESFEAGGRAYAVDEAIASAGQRGGYRGVRRRQWHLGKQEHENEQLDRRTRNLAQASLSLLEVGRWHRRRPRLRTVQSKLSSHAFSQ